ncbi:ABC transporter permease [Parapedobacter tibetensis]|uniref:ABC transporter permease n=1 Tax=Parapedobacter tibetensis TaxID=2972951 RepID=UPI00214DB1B9|nr:ABC transporter permease [Parapedobacter tibetensis]
MFRNFLFITVRNFAKRKVFTAVHILGLSMAFGAAILLFLTAMFELSYDNFHMNRDRIGFVYEESNPTTGKAYGETKPIPFGPALKAELPSVERMSRYGNGGVILRHADKQFAASAKFVDVDFLQMFSFPLRQGRETALENLDGIVISEAMADNLFGHTDVVGQPVEAQVNGQWQSKLVTAVTETLPRNSSLTFNTLLRFEHLMPDYQAYLDNWDHANHGVFIQWADGKLDPATFNRQARPFMATHYTKGIANLKRDGAQPDGNGEYLALKALPLKAYHLNSLGIGGGSNPTFPWMLLLLAGLILFIAGSNFVNLSLASSFTRGREIAMRRTLGGRTWQLITQLWGESLVVCLLALGLGGVLAWGLLPQYNANMNYSLQMGMLFTGRNVALFTLAFLLITVVAGGYPAWAMARINTITTLKGKFQLNSGGGLRNTLTVVQFAIAVALIIGTLVVSNQLHFLQTRPLGFNKTEVISIPIGDELDGETAIKRMRAELAALPQVESVSGSDINIGRGHDGGMSTSIIGFEHEGRTVRSHYLRVDYDYLAALDIELVAGRDFSRDFATDTNAVVINEQMAAQLGGIDKVLGQPTPIRGWGGNQVIGVVKDYNFKDLRQQIEPLTMTINPHDFPIEYLFVKVRPENLSASLQAVEQVWEKVNPGANEEASYLDENTDNQYQRDKRFANIIVSGAALAITISCMGLFAIALLSINRRVKEIGVRKVLGASVSGITLLLSRGFMKMVGIAFAIGAPVAWWASNKWLEDFAYRIDVDIWLLALGGAIVLLVALATVITQSLRAAVANPVDSLRDE